MTPISARVRAIICDLAGVIPETVGMDSRIDETLMGSRKHLGHACDLMARSLEKVGCPEIPSRDSSRWITVGDIIRFLEAREAQARG